VTSGRVSSQNGSHAPVKISLNMSAHPILNTEKDLFTTSENDLDKYTTVNAYYPLIQTSNAEGITIYSSQYTSPPSLQFNGHFPGGPGLASSRMSPSWIYWSKG